MAVDISPRPVNEAERAVLRHILSAGFPGAEELRAQVDACEVIRLWGVGSVSVDLRVADEPPRSAAASGPVPVDAVVSDESGELEGEILVWVENGYLSGLEYAWYGDDMPRELPPVERVALQRRE